MVPPEPRLPLARLFIERSYFFVVHAPRQSGKTTTLQSLARTLTAEGWHAAVHFSCETGRVGDDLDLVQEAVLDALASAARSALPAECWPPAPWPSASTASRLKTALTEWAKRCPRPLVLVFDEIDALQGNSLLSVLSQLGDGYNSRPAPFPASVVLCGLRDVRDYKTASVAYATQPPVDAAAVRATLLEGVRMATSSPFNVTVGSLRIADFTEEQVRELYGQHTAQTGQPFTGEAVARAWEYAAGQPWLVNALAREVVDLMEVPVTEPVTVEHVEQAKERLIRARATHLDSLVARLAEPRVQRIMEPLIGGDVPTSDLTYNDDLSYLRDLGLIAVDAPIRVANPIYREVIVRVLAAKAEDLVTADPRTFVLPDGGLDFRRLLEEFAAFWREHAEFLVPHATYPEVEPQLILMAFLHRLVNGGGQIDREYGVGRGRIDLLVRWPYRGADGARHWQREAVELKVWRPGRPDPTGDGLRQLDGYLDRLGLDHGTLAIFDRRASDTGAATSVEFEAATSPSGRKITLLLARAATG